MTDRPTRILAIGDMHLGRAPSRVPALLDELGRDLASLGPGAGWLRAVASALELEVAAVLLAGDLVDSENARFEAWGQLQGGVQQLAAAGIPAIAVAGNHDVAVLSRLGPQLSGLRVLGRAGRWESLVVAGSGGPPVEIVGWSFPGPRVDNSPLDSPLPASAGDVAARLGLLHADLDSPRSPYAPVARAELEAAGLDAWLLGHIHKPSLTRDAGTTGWLGYLGSLVGLDPTETGTHGPWVLTVAAEGGVTAEQLPLAPLRWEHVTLAVDGWEEPATALEAETLAVLERVLVATPSASASASPGAPATALPPDTTVGVTIELTGRCRDHSALRAAMQSVRDGAPVHHGGDTVAFLAGFHDDARPGWDLHALARSEDPPGLLARRLLELEAGAEESETLVESARATLRDRATAPAFLPLEIAEPTPAVARERLLRAGLHALDRLLRQKEEGGATA